MGIAAVREPLKQRVHRLLGYDGCMNFFSGPTDKAFSATINLYNCHYSSTHILGTTGGNTEDLKEAIRLRPPALPAAHPPAARKTPGP